MAKLLQKTDKVIVMMQYRPSLAQDKVYGVYRAMEQIPPTSEQPLVKLNRLIETVYKQVVIPLAIKHRLAVIDLPNTLDPNDTSLFVSQIEPSYDGGKKISQLIAHAVQNHDFSQNGKSLMYSLEGENVVAKETSVDWKVKL